MRATKWSDVRDVAGWLNDQSTTYAIHGGWAARMWGVNVPPSDLDIIVPYLQAEYEKVKLALGNLPTQKTLQADVSNRMQYGTWRISDDYVTDVCSAVTDMAYASFEIIPVIVDGGLTIPFASGDTLFRLYERAFRANVKFHVCYEALRQLGYNGVYENKVIDPNVPGTPPDALVQASHALPVTEDFLSAGD